MYNRVNMYLEHFGFKKMPFENLCEREFFFESENHREAYSRISFVIESKKTLAVLYGPYGTGKTFILKAIESDYSKKNYIFSYLSNPSLDETGILKMITYNFVNFRMPDSKTDILISLEKFLKDTHRDGKHCVVMIDEAQNIESEKVFEELRMLLNFEINSKPIITMIIAGQSELSNRISSNKQFLQRVFLSYELKPFNKEETREYVIHRLKVAGNEKVFEEDCFDILYELSGGIARWINNISSMSLLCAFNKNLSKVNADIVREAYSSIKGEV
jgi:type II secretory pathway predicted ATPase ExeA